MNLTREHRLAVYGTLAPGRPNEHVLADAGGRWIAGTVRGTRYEEGWGAALGYPAIVLDDGGDVECLVLESEQLPTLWREIDEFEGVGYVREPVTVKTDEGTLEAYIYRLA